MVRIRFPTPFLNGSGCEGTAGFPANLSKSSPSMKYLIIVSTIALILSNRI